MSLFYSVSVRSLQNVTFSKDTFSLPVVFIFYSIDVWKISHPTQVFLLDHSSLRWLVETFFLQCL